MTESEQIHHNTSPKSSCGGGRALINAREREKEKEKDRGGADAGSAREKGGGVEGAKIERSIWSRVGMNSEAERVCAEGAVPYSLH